jgi:thioredoxin-related protein
LSPWRSRKNKERRENDPAGPARADEIDGPLLARGADMTETAFVGRIMDFRPHVHEAPMRSIVTVMFGIVLAAAPGATAADKNKPPRSDPNLKPVMAEGLEWSGDLASALAVAAKEKKLVFIDFTGVTCTNCKINEKNVFSKDDVKAQFSRYVRVQLYTDQIPAKFYTKEPGEEQRDKDAEVNQAFQEANFGGAQLPLYVIVKPTENGAFEKVAIYDEGRIAKIDKFVEFLKKPLDAK